MTERRPAEETARPVVAGIPNFWEKLRTASRPCLVLDYDGTLSEFKKDRMAAFPVDGVVDTLLRIRDNTDTYLAIMTGRPVAELLSLLGDLRIPVSGSQGTEFRYPDGTYDTLIPSDRQQQRLRRAEKEARAIARVGHVERKIASVGLHTRGTPPEDAKREEDEACAAWSGDAAEYDLECRRFKGGVEMRLIDIDKGTALHTLLRDRPRDGFCVYIGDDLTDEDAFRAIRDRGYGIKVGGPEEETEATGRLRNPEEVERFLEAWLDVRAGRTTT